MPDASGSSVPRPGLVTTPLTQAYWQAASEGRLLLQRCLDCGQAQHYPRSLCAKCWSRQVESFDGSGRGRIVTFTDITMPGHPAWLEEAPYTIAIIELEEGPRLLARVDPPTAVTVGDLVRLANPDRDGIHRFEVIREG
ncbi:Zn-ribbon domain-containing OB-fold protein [Ruicaihuangia caeni]|uniref:Zinc ribbon domain-containing protein n=1 Tax=Ruicaihuangia caeni TaxID=3042517 RepID=A0AAW6T5M6_9MICO|nr:zinc ribbon domain-containing protein [Klugiella sp. YN-L-19]MDI2097390.1 zinc ribbon domain-containing protein [Klugiella sp. YN-L-19]